MFDFDQLDERTSRLTESVARAVSRRRVLVRTAKGIAATIAGVTLGQLIAVRNAFADSCSCNWYGGSGNANCPSWPHPCPWGQGCPSGCSVCTSSDVCRNGVYYCNYAGGSWGTCYGGKCGNGHYVCTDCKCPNCSYVCTCLSQEFYCGNCCTPQEVEAEMRRLVAGAATAAI